MIRAARHIPSVRAVATIGTPYDPRHVKDSLPEVAAVLEAAADGETLEIPGRGVTVGAEFFRDLREVDPDADFSALRESAVSHLAIHSLMMMWLLFKRHSILSPTPPVFPAS